MAARELGLTEAKAAHVRPVGVAARSEAGANKAGVDLQGLQIRLGKVEQEAKLASASLDKAQKKFARLLKT